MILSLKVDVRVPIIAEEKVSVSVSSNDAVTTAVDNQHVIVYSFSRFFFL